MEKYKERFSKYEKNRWTGLTISLCIVVVFYMLVSNIGNFKGFFDSFFAITSTVIIGAVIAYTANPFACFIYKRIEKKFKENHKNRAWVLSAVLSLTTMLLLIAGLIVLIAPRLIENITALRATFGASAHLQWEWLRMDEDRYGVISADDSRLSDGGFRLTLGPADVDVKVTFRCALITE